MVPFYLLGPEGSVTRVGGSPHPTGDGPLRQTEKGLQQITLPRVRGKRHYKWTSRRPAQEGGKDPGDQNLLLNPIESVIRNLGNYRPPPTLDPQVTLYPRNSFKVPVDRDDTLPLPTTTGDTTATATTTTTAAVTTTAGCQYVVIAVCDTTKVGVITTPVHTLIGVTGLLCLRVPPLLRRFLGRLTV